MKYADAQLREQDAVIKRTHRLFFLSSEGAMALPWNIGRTRNWTYYLREDGGTDGFRTFIALFPDEQIGVVLLSNETDEHAGGQLYELFNAILNGLRD